jgi:hypothetical protein
LEAVKSLIANIMKKRMEKEDFERLEFSIGCQIPCFSPNPVRIFHCFAHVFQCQALYSPRMIEGIGLSNGEGNKRVWSRERHVIPSLRVVTPGKRFQILTELGLFVAEEKDRNMDTQLTISKTASNYSNYA